MITVDEANELVKGILSEKRYYHSVCVMERCAEYAEMLGLNVEDAKIIGLMHDLAKEMSKEEKKEYCEENGIEIDDVERQHLTLLHGKIAAHICKTKYGLSDELADAIKYHTTGRKNMTIWEKVLYVADTTGKDRNYSNTEYFYNLSKENLDKALIEILKFVINDRLEEGKMIHMYSVEAYNDLVLKESNKE